MRSTCPKLGLGLIMIIYMRKHQFVKGEYYHIYVHAVGDFLLCKEDKEYQRFLAALFAANGIKSMPRLDRLPASDLNSVWGIKDGKKDADIPLIDIVSFSIMPNHLHFLLGERANGNISLFMHKILVSHAKYLNKKYERRGHVFESKFHSRHIGDNEYLLKASAYIHLNPKDLPQWHKKEHKYPWSSFQDYVSENRWGGLLATDIILEQFNLDKDGYRKFVEESRNNEEDWFS